MMQRDQTRNTSDRPHTPVLVDSQATLAQLVASLALQDRIAIDTESNSLYAYREQVCLIQLSVPGTDYLIDPLALDDLSPLAPLLASRDVEKLFHAADYDLMVLRRDFGYETHNIFDTMWAARILGWPKVGLADVLATHFDVHPNKKWQRYNWGRRPLDPQALTYAWMDSHYLLPLREIQKAELEATGRWPEAQEVFAYLENTVEVPPDEDDQKYFWRIKGAHRLRHYELQKLYQLYLWREEMAERLDRPPMKVISNRWLMRLVQTMPRNHEEMAALGLSPALVRRYGTGILQALRDDDLPEPPHPPQNPRPDDEVVDRYQSLKAWRKGVAAARGVDSDVILPNAVLWELATNPPDDLASLLEVPGIGPWRQATYGPDLLQLVTD
ncbi:MAG: ribonuclease D [Anaerolineae bacterium]|nr:ribonuclease D [Anaerolineae bacterium]